MLYKKTSDTDCYARQVCSFEPDPEAANNAALGRITRAYDWGAETWEAAGRDCATRGLLSGLADKCRDIAALMRKQEAGHDKDGA